MSRTSENALVENLCNKVETIAKGTKRKILTVSYLAAGICCMVGATATNTAASKMREHKEIKEKNMAIVEAQEKLSEYRSLESRMLQMGVTITPETNFINSLEKSIGNHPITETEDYQKIMRDLKKEELVSGNLMLLRNLIDKEKIPIENGVLLYNSLILSIFGLGIANLNAGKNKVNALNNNVRAVKDNIRAGVRGKCADSIYDYIEMYIKHLGDDLSELNKYVKELKFVTDTAPEEILPYIGIFLAKNHEPPKWKSIYDLTRHGKSPIYKVAFVNRVEDCVDDIHSNLNEFSRKVGIPYDEVEKRLVETSTKAEWVAEYKTWVGKENFYRNLSKFYTDLMAEQIEQA